MSNASAHFETVSVIGLGKLGSGMAACFAAKGFRTYGVDVDAAKVDAINSGCAPFFEPQLQETIDRGRGLLTASQDIREAILNSEASFIIVPTPSEPDGGFSLRLVIPVFEAIGKALREKRGFHVVVLTSTVMPGSMEHRLQPIIEQASGLRAGVDFGLCYSPEFIALGSVIHDLLTPDFVLIGESDPRSGALLEQTYLKHCDNRPAVARMNFVNAELTKLSVNTFVTTKISFANMIARICERLPESDVNVVTAALGLDTRIGPRYLKGAIGYGGPCFPRDNKALAHLAHTIGAPATIAEGTDAFNRGEALRLVSLIESKLPANAKATIAILGLSYKPNTDVIEESQSVYLAKALVERGYRTIVHDPAALNNTRAALGSSVEYFEALSDCLDDADVIVIATPWAEYKSIEPSHLARNGTPRVVVDCWRMLDAEKFAPVSTYVALGKG